MKTIEELDQFQSAYNRKFKFYQENQWYLSHYADRICNVIRDVQPSNLLSLGIGHQAVSQRILQEVASNLKSYQILEGSKEIIRKFKSENKLPSQVKIIHTYFEDYDPGQTFDAIEMGFVLEHVDDPELLVRKYSKHLTPGGILFIAVPNARSLHRIIGFEAGLLDDVYSLSDQDYELGHKRYFDLDSICQLIENAGLLITHRQGLMLKPITGAQINQLGWGENIIRALLTVGDGYPEIANCILIEATR
jgi:SAM-dependent methyltransferase